MWQWCYRDSEKRFEPVHGSVPDNADQGIANPVGQIWLGAMMLNHVGESDGSTDVCRPWHRRVAGRWGR